MVDNTEVKLFSLDRLARFKSAKNGDTIWIVPGEVVSILSLDGEETWVEYGYGSRAVVEGTAQSVEDEINRALGATLTAHVQHINNQSDRLKAIVNNALKDEDEEIIKLNDFYPKGVN